jgi:hypothetical protein
MRRELTATCDAIDCTLELDLVARLASKQVMAAAVESAPVLR